MSEEKAKIRLEIGHVLFIDIVGYSRLLINEQSEQIQKLREIVRGTEQVRLAEAEGKLLRFPTGDGGALVFRTSPEAPVLCALEIAEALKRCPELQVRMGIHSGPVNEVTDLNEQANIAGAGINLAERVMDCGDAGHILLSKHVADDLEHYPQWRPYLHPLGEYQVKHGVNVSLVNLHTDELGNLEVPEKLRQARVTQNTETIPEAPARRSWRWIAALIITTVGVGAGGSYIFLGRSNRSAAESSAVGEKSIAVLPFENLSRDPDNAYFVDGTQDEILTRLAKISALKVISRTSTMRYASHPSDLRQIARELGVAHILEGSVQRADGTVRVNVQLIEVETDSHVWAETFDREIKNIFSVESEIAQNVAEALRAKLLPRETARVANVPTKNPEAYDLFLKASYVFDHIANESDPAVAGHQAADLYEKAIAADPNFALAYCGLSSVKGSLYWANEDSSSEMIEAAQRAAERALELQPNLAEAHLTMGFIHYWGHRDYEAALAEFLTARESLPNSPDVFTALAALHRRQGKMSGAIHEFEQAAALDPSNSQTQREIGLTLASLRRYPEANAAYKRAIALYPDSVQQQVDWALILMVSGNLDAADQALAAISLEADPQGAVSFARCELALTRRQPDAALSVLAHAPEWLTYGLSVSRQPITLLRALALAQKNQTEAAREALDAAQRTLESLLDNPREKADAQSYLALVYAGLGKKEMALAAGRHAVAALPLTHDALVGSFYLARLAMAEGQLGETKLALDHVEQLMALPTGHVISAASLRAGQEWDPLRGDPRFQALVQKVDEPNGGTKQ